MQGDYTSKVYDGCGSASYGKPHSRQIPATTNNLRDYQPYMPLKDLRLKAGMTVTEFARQMNVARWTVYKWENGKASMSLAVKHYAAKVLGIQSIEDLEHK